MRIKLTTLCTLLLGALLVVFPSKAAFAASDYDNAVRIVDDLTLTNWNSTTTLDISADYLQRMQGCNSTAYSSFVNSVSDGGNWAISIHRSWQGAFLNGSKDEVVIYWTTNTPGYLQTVSFHDAEGFENAQIVSDNAFTMGINASGSIFCSYSGPIDGNSYRYISTDGTNTYNDWKTYLATFPVESVGGYEGETIRTGPPTPSATTIYNGSVDCGNDSLEYLLITQDGSTNPVALSYQSNYSASWSYGLTSSEYSITVGCGNTLAASYGSVSPATSSNDWICDTVNDPHYCILS